jgi:hypothetical protein
MQIPDIGDHSWSVGQLTVTSENSTDDTELPHDDDDISTISAVIQMSCELTVHGVLDAVFFGGRDVTHQVSGSFEDWHQKKQFNIAAIGNELLVISVHSLAEASNCSGGAFHVKCSSSFTYEAVWESFGSAQPIDLEHKLGAGSGWSKPCRATSAYELEVSSALSAIWIPSGMYASFRWRIGSCGEFSKLDLLPSSSMEFSSLVVTEHTHLHNLHTCSEMPIALHGEMCLAECPLGSRIRSHVLSCQLGRWNSSRAACPRLQCHTLPAVTSDMVNHDSLLACLGLDFGGACEIKCLDGRVAGSLSCGESSRWSGTVFCPPKCPYALDALLMREAANCSNNSDGGLCMAPCSAGYEGTDTLRCKGGEWLLDVNGTHCSRVGVTRPLMQAVVTVTMHNVSYEALVANTSLFEAFKAAALQVVVSSSGAGIQAKHIDIEVFAGSVIVKATITPPESIGIDQVRSNLLEATPAVLGQALIAGVTEVEGFHAVTTGEVRAGDVIIALARPTTSTPLRGSSDSSSSGSGGIIAGVLIVVVMLSCSAFGVWWLLRTQRCNRYTALLDLFQKSSASSDRVPEILKNCVAQCRPLCRLGCWRWRSGGVSSGNIICSITALSPTAAATVCSKHMSTKLLPQTDLVAVPTLRLTSPASSVSKNVATSCAYSGRSSD